MRRPFKGAEAMKKNRMIGSLIAMSLAFSSLAVALSFHSPKSLEAATSKKENTSLVQLWIRKANDTWDDIFVDFWARNCDWVQLNGKAVDCNADTSLSYENKVTTPSKSGTPISLLSYAYQYANEGGSTMSFVGAKGTGFAGDNGINWQKQIITVAKGTEFPSFQYTNAGGNPLCYTEMAEQKFAYSYTDGNGSLVFTPVFTTMENEIASVSTQECYDDLGKGQEDHHVRLYINMVKGDWDSAPKYSSESSGVAALNIAKYLLVDGKTPNLKGSYNYNFVGTNSLLLILNDDKDTFKTLTFLKGCEFYSYSSHTTGEDKVYVLNKDMTFDKGAITASDPNGDHSYGYVERTYKITFTDEKGNVLQEGKVSFNSIPLYEGETPKKEMSEEFSYTFAGWSPALTAAVEDATYTATFTSATNSYLVIFADFDGTVLQMGELTYGSIPVYTGATPSRANDVYGSYVYEGWDKPVGAVHGQCVYYASYKKTANTVTITFLNEDGTALESDSCNYGDLPVYKGKTPEKAPKDEKTAYAFASWSPTLKKATADATYTAIFKEVVRTYTVAFYDGDTLLSSEEIAYGSTLSEPSTPEKEGATFDGWYADGKKFDFSTPVTSALRLEARFISPKQPLPAYVPYVIAGGVLLLVGVGVLTVFLVKKKKKA